MLEGALDICTIKERKVVVTTDKDGATSAEFTEYLIETIKSVLADVVIERLAKA